MGAAREHVFAGKFEVERVLGEGGMGVVVAARHVRLGHRFAIKILPLALRDQPELVLRFEREARAAGALSSRHAVRVFDIDSAEDGTPFIVMELLVGCDLGQLLEREGRQPLARATRWVIEACEAIAEAHALGIVHRDLKPSNLFLAEHDGDVVLKVLDFGIAKMQRSGDAHLTHAALPLGTPQYMSPEQVRCARDVDGRSDVWSLGVTLYELVTGRPPFAFEEATACIASIAADPVPDPRTFQADLPDAFVDVLMHALEKDPSARFASIEELALALSPFSAGEDGEVSAVIRRVREEPPRIVPAPAPRRPSKGAVAIGAAASFGLALALMTPKCVKDDAASASHTTTSAVIEVTPSAVASKERETDRAAAPEEPAPDVAMPQPSATPVVRKVAPARARTTQRTAHGGLSGPGF